MWRRSVGEKVWKEESPRGSERRIEWGEKESVESKKESVWKGELGESRREGDIEGERKKESRRESRRERGVER